MKLNLRGLVAATFTPMHSGGSLNLPAIAPMVDLLCEQRIGGLYVLGSTGEGVSLAEDERKQVAEQFVATAAGRIPVIVQVGCDSLVQARRLASHAAEIGADAISSVSPVYFKPEDLQTLVDCMGDIASAADLPFYYYHIPRLAGGQEQAFEFLGLADRQIPNLAGIKFTSPSVQHFQECLEFGDGKYDLLWGMDEMLLSGLVAGAVAAVGSTYNFAAPLYHKILAAFEAGDLDAARLWQARSQLLVRTFVPYGRGAQKAIMSMVTAGTAADCGSARLPIRTLDAAEVASLHGDLESIGFFDWSTAPAVTPDS